MSGTHRTLLAPGGLGTDLRTNLVLRHWVPFNSSQKTAWTSCAQDASAEGHAQKVPSGNHPMKKAVSPFYERSWVDLVSDIAVRRGVLLNLVTDIFCYCLVLPLWKL